MGPHAAPLGTRPRQRRGLPDEAMDRACRMALRGIDAETIAAVLQVSERRVKVALSSRNGRQRVRWLRGQQLLSEIEHEQAMRQLLPDARRAIGQGMSQSPAKDAAKVALALHEAVVAKPAQKIEHTHQGRIEHDLGPVFERLQEGLAKVREAQLGKDPLARVMRGDLGLAKHRPLLPSGEE
jgi:hypothetical protein